MVFLMVTFPLRYNDDDVDDDCELFAMVEDRTRKRIIIMEDEGEAAVA